jgi:hypothetical protein
MGLTIRPSCVTLHFTHRTEPASSSSLSKCLTCCHRCLPASLRTPRLLPSFGKRHRPTATFPHVLLLSIYSLSHTAHRQFRSSQDSELCPPLCFPKHDRIHSYRTVVRLHSHSCSTIIRYVLPLRHPQNGGHPYVSPSLPGLPQLHNPSTSPDRKEEKTWSFQTMRCRQEMQLPDIFSLLLGKGPRFELLRLFLAHMFLILPYVLIDLSVFVMCVFCIIRMKFSFYNVY